MVMGPDETGGRWWLPGHQEILAAHHGFLPASIVDGPPPLKRDRRDRDRRGLHVAVETAQT